MKFVLAATVAVVASADVITPEIMSAFKSFQTKFNKNYADDAEWAKRMGIFAGNIERVGQLNKDHLLAGGDNVHGITKFSDLTAEEFKGMYLNYMPNNSSSVERVTVTLDGPMADDVDWRTKGAVTEVKDQGQCGSCWAFSATEAIESYAFLAGMDLQKLSAQQINSCDKVDQGCNGGNSESAYDYVRKAGGLESESAYPYTSGGGNTGTCKAKGSPAVTIKGYTSVSKGETNLQAALNNGPVSVCLAAEAFQSYSGGVLKVCRGQVDHCVQAVGYSTSGNYWIVRNSWAANWGEEGYIRLEMGKDLCKVSDDVTYPTF